jgi:hypothetical protein
MSNSKHTEKDVLRSIATYNIPLLLQLREKLYNHELKLQCKKTSQINSL